jgi:hypothetical protein
MSWTNGGIENGQSEVLAALPRRRHSSSSGPAPRSLGFRSDSFQES